MTKTLFLLPVFFRNVNMTMKCNQQLHNMNEIIKALWHDSNKIHHGTNVHLLLNSKIRRLNGAKCSTWLVRGPTSAETLLHHYVPIGTSLHWEHCSRVLFSFCFFTNKKKRNWPIGASFCQKLALNINDKNISCCLSEWKLSKIQSSVQELRKKKHF